MYNLKAVKKEFHDKGIFYTPTALADLIKSYVKKEPAEVYDPTCGDGALLSVFGDNVKKYGQEINEDQLNVAKSRLKNFTGVSGDTLKFDAFADKKFECIVANPPFSISWEPPKLGDVFTDKRFQNIPAVPPKSKADYAFILHILYHLLDDGIAVVLGFPGILYRGNSEEAIRKWMVEKNYVDKVIRIPGKTFIDTAIETVLLIFRKNKTTTDIEFVDTTNDKKYLATFDEVKSNGFNLSVNFFIHDEKEIVEYDPSELQTNSRKQMINKLMKDIEMDKIVCELEGYDFESYIDELQAVLDSYR